MAEVKRPVRLAYLVSHPIQYQVPLLRRIAAEPDIDLTVLYGSDFSVRGYKDDGFGVDLKWDLPLLDGYKYEILPALRDTGTQTFAAPLNYGIFSRLRGRGGEAPYDLLWVHGYAMVNSMVAMVAAKALGIPVLMRSDSTLIDRPRGGAKRFAKRLFFAGLRQMIDGVLTIGTLNEGYWRASVGDSVPLFRMPYAVDNDFFRRRSEEAASRRGELLAELKMEAGRPVILFASKLQYRKHADHLLEAYRRLIERSSAGPYLVIVGDGEARAELGRSAAGLEDVRFCGFRNQSELPRFFDLATVFVLPARHEPWGLIVNEVMNAARPVIMTDDVGAHPDLVTNGVEGYVYPVGDIAALTEALDRVISVPGEAERMGRNALARISAWNFEEDIAGLRRAIAALTKGLPVEREFAAK
ncbi:glycosyltransferase family 4 protein [Edaphobacter aggregans]|uniref:glycosyltransferase family 4 protein n=1 Tax=Edaphobacter aggregans TaxID=570835 RepID=UPI0005568190|nr:glycosyltransferase family 4 protein [Edaphobacter aggregans]